MAVLIADGPDSSCTTRIFSVAIVSYQVNRGKSCFAVITLFAFTLSLPKILSTCFEALPHRIAQNFQLSCKTLGFLVEYCTKFGLFHCYIYCYSDFYLFLLTDVFYHPNVFFQWMLLAGMKYRICTEKKTVSSVCSELDCWFHISKHLFGLCLIIICAAFFAKCIYVILLVQNYQHVL